MSVSYTHLDVYKRQVADCIKVTPVHHSQLNSANPGEMTCYWESVLMKLLINVLFVDCSNLDYFYVFFYLIHKAILRSKCFSLLGSCFAHLVVCLVHQLSLFLFLDNTCVLVDCWYGFNLVCLFGFMLLCIGMVSVSYTHLDVYKRQEYMVKLRDVHKTQDDLIPE